jgi:hypothetical protein
MQYIPKGTPMHEKLSTGFVRVEALFDELRAQGFTGYVLINFPQSAGYIWFSNGQVLNAIEESQRERHAGISVTEQLLRQASQTRGTISIYNLQNEAVIAMAGIAEGQLIYENLTSDFASLAKLIKKVSREHKLHFISLTFTDQPKEGGLIYIDGERVEVFCSTQQGDLTGSQALQQLVTQSEGRLAAFSLFRARGADLPAFDERDVETSLNRLTQNLTTPAPPIPPLPIPPPLAAAWASPHSASTAISASGQPAGTPTAVSAPSPVREVAPFTSPRSDLANGAASLLPPQTAQPKPATAETEDILDVPETAPEVDSTVSKTAPGTAGLRSAPTGKTGTGIPATAPLTPVATQVTLAEPKSGAEMAELTSLMSQVIAAVERGMTVAGRGSSFPTALRAGLLAVTEQYPFLDPFAAEFEYHDREIVFVGSAQPEEFSKGLTEALRQMVEDLIYSSNGRVRDYISEELMKVERERSDELTRFGLENLTRRICQN